MKKLLILHIILSTVLTLSAQNVKELQKQQRELQQQLEQTSNMLKQTKQNETATINKLTLLNNDIQTRKKLIKNIQSEINGLNLEMGQLRDKRAELQAQLEACKEDYARLVKENLEKENFVPEIVKIEIGAITISGSYTTAEQNALVGAVTIYKTVFDNLYDISVALDTKVSSEAQSLLFVADVENLAQNILQEMQELML